MDVAEQSLTALEMLSRRHSKAILQAVRDVFVEIFTPPIFECRRQLAIPLLSFQIQQHNSWLE